MHRSTDSSGWQQTKELLSAARAIKDRLRVIMVTNIKNRTAASRNYVGHSIITEFLSENELEEIVGALRYHGLHVELFIEEREFIKWVLTRGSSDCQGKLCLVCNNAQNGTGPGRKSLIPAFCDLNGLPTANSDPYVVSLARHKYHLNRLLREFNLPVPESWLYQYGHGWLLGKRPPNGVEAIAKLTFESASIGIYAKSVQEVGQNFDDYITELSREYNQPITVQEFINGYEVEVPVIGLPNPFAPSIVGISLEGGGFLGNKILTYESVYGDSYSFYDFRDLPTGVLKRIRECAVSAYEAIGIRGLGRVDFRVTEKGKYYIIDIATNPHIAKHSSYAHLYRLHSLDYSDLPLTLVALACKRNQWI